MRILIQRSERLDVKEEVQMKKSFAKMLEENLGFRKGLGAYVYASITMIRYVMKMKTNYALLSQSLASL